MTESARSLSPGGPRSSPARQASLRSHNLGVLLTAVVDSEIAPSRADLAQATGLTRATVSALTDQLLAAGLVTVLPTVRAVSAGRPAAPLVPAAGTLAAVGAEINVDYLAVRVVDLTGATLGERIVPGDHRASDPAPVLAALAALCREVMGTAAADLPVAGLCVALPGLVDSGAGRLRIAPNLGWRDVDVVGALSGLLDRPGLQVVQANEATLAAQAEARALRASGVASFFYVSGEIGIGGALVRDGRIVAGSHGWSGEIGHTLVDPAGPDCGCGAIGCLEQYAGADALLRRCRAADRPRDRRSRRPRRAGCARCAGRPAGRRARPRPGPVDRGEPARRRHRRAGRHFRRADRPSARAAAAAAPEPGAVGHMGAGRRAAGPGDQRGRAHRRRTVDAVRDRRRPAGLD